MANEFVEKIRAAVALLDHQSDDDWTEKGLPNVNRVRDLTDDASITRADIQAAMPDFTRTTATEGGHAEEEPAAGTAATPEAGNPQEQAGDTATNPADGADTEADQEDAAEGDALGGDVEESDMTMSDFVTRGLLMAVVMRLPKPMRVVADGVMLGRMADFVSSYGMHEERMVAIEMIKAIAETHPQEIPSGLYQGRVSAAMNVVRGEADMVRDRVAPADDKEAAAARLAKLTGSQRTHPPGYEAPSVLAGATDDQKAAHARLFGETPDEGVRSADE